MILRKRMWIISEKMRLEFGDLNVIIGFVIINKFDFELVIKLFWISFLSFKIKKVVFDSVKCYF